jgi:hypothetical protein
MEPEGSLPHSQEPATCPYPERCFIWVFLTRPTLLPLGQKYEMTAVPQFWAFKYPEMK